MDTNNTEITPKPEPNLFSIYKAESAGKFFLKYQDKEEEEISELMYNNLLAQKDRIFDSKMREPVSYDKKPTVMSEENYKSYDTELVIEIYPTRNEGIKDFVCGTCYGNLYYTENCIVLDSFYNKEKHNGHFYKVIKTFLEFADKKGYNITICNVNSKLFQAINKEFTGTNILQVNKTTILFKN